jgi:hypothetical protein
MMNLLSFNSEIEDHPKNINIKLKKHQLAMLKKCKEIESKDNIFGIMNDKPGTGKTYAACAVCKVKGIRPLIAAPKQSIPAWYRICELFDVEPLGVVNYETLKNGKYYESLNDFYLEQRVDCPYLVVEREVIKDQLGDLGVWMP